MPPDPEDVGLPPRVFLYTLDQICQVLSIQSVALRRHLYLDGQSTGRQKPRQLRARNISTDPEGRPDWRVSEPELIRWMKSRGFKYQHRGWVE